MDESRSGTDDLDAKRPILYIEYGGGDALRLDPRARKAVVLQTRRVLHHNRCPILARNDFERKPPVWPHVYGFDPALDLNPPV